MVASGNGNNQYSERKICEKFTVMGHMKAMWRAFSQKKKNQQKMKLTIPKISRTFQTQAIQKIKNQTTTMIKKDL